MDGHANWFYHTFLDLDAIGLPVVFRNLFTHVWWTLYLIPQQLLQSFPLFSKPNTCPILASGDLTFYSLEKCELPTENAFSFLPVCIKMSLYPHFPFHPSPLCWGKTYTSFLLRFLPYFNPILLATFCRLDPSTTPSNLHPQSILIPGSFSSVYKHSHLPHPKKENASLNPTTPQHYQSCFSSNDLKWYILTSPQYFSQ